MPLRPRFWRALFFIVVSLASSLAAAQDRGAFVRVDSAGCESGPRRASGFVWNNTQTVVTALHAVAGCSSISVRYAVDGGQLRKAHVTRLVRRFDLALLTIENPVKVTP